MPLVVRNDGKGLVQQFQKLEAEYISRIQETQSKALQSELIEKGLNLQQSYLQTSK